MKTNVIFHKADFDGIFCREIARKFLADANLIGWDYGDPVPTPDVVSADDPLYMLDISVEGLMGHPKLVWIDHHKSAIEKYGSKFFGMRLPRSYCIDGVAACRLAWQYFTQTPMVADTNHLPNKERYVKREVSEPFAVRLAGEYDIWDKRDPDAELFQHGLRSMELTEEVWSGLLAPEESRQTAWVGKLLLNGVALQYARAKENASIIKELGFTFQWEGLTWIACNHARYNSHLFTAGLKPEHDACFGFKWTGKDWSVSLYHAPGKEHHDLSLIAVKYRGGGHKGACGMRLKNLPFIANS